MFHIPSYRVISFQGSTKSKEPRQAGQTKGNWLAWGKYIYFLFIYSFYHSVCFVCEYFE